MHGGLFHLASRFCANDLITGVVCSAALIIDLLSIVSASGGTRLSLLSTFHPTPKMLQPITKSSSDRGGQLTIIPTRTPSAETLSGIESTVDPVSISQLVTPLTKPRQQLATGRAGNDCIQTGIISSALSSSIHSLSNSRLLTNSSDPDGQTSTSTERKRILSVASFDTESTQSHRALCTQMHRHKKSIGRNRLQVKETTWHRPELALVHHLPIEVDSSHFPHLFNSLFRY